MSFEARFAGIGRLYGRAAMERISLAHVCVIGLGGVGSWTVEALARSGVGSLTLVDLDDVCITNTNRQIHAVTASIGRPKAEVLRDRVLAINPEAQVRIICDYFTASTAESILAPGYDVVVDAIDQFRNKCRLLDACRALEQRLVVVGGAGGRRDPTRVRIADISRSEGDKLLSMLRKRLRQKHAFPRKDAWGIPCVFSDEPPSYPTADGEVCTTRPEGQGLRLDCRSGYGAAVFVTGTFGFLAASATVDLLVGQPIAAALVG